MPHDATPQGRYRPSPSRPSRRRERGGEAEHQGHKHSSREGTRVALGFICRILALSYGSLTAAGATRSSPARSSRTSRFARSSSSCASVQQRMPTPQPRSTRRRRRPRRSRASPLNEAAVDEIDRDTRKLVQFVSSQRTPEVCSRSGSPRTGRIRAARAMQGSITSAKAAAGPCSCSSPPASAGAAVRARELARRWRRKARAEELPTHRVVASAAGNWRRECRDRDQLPADRDQRCLDGVGDGRPCPAPAAVPRRSQRRARNFSSVHRILPAG